MIRVIRLPIAKEAFVATAAAIAMVGTIPR